MIILNNFNTSDSIIKGKKMYSFNKWIGLLVLCLFFTSINSNAFATERTENKQENTINRKINTAHLDGINLWIANLYNDDRLLYAVVVTLVMAVLGSIIAFGTDVVLKLLGINVTKISHKE